MEQRTRVIIIGAIALLLIAAVLAAVVFIGRITRSNTPKLSDNPDVTLQDLAATPTPPQTGATTGGSNTKIFTGDGYSLQYPQSWAVLTCSNSSNFELDPTNANDVKGAVCDYAVKPVTFLVSGSRVSCAGEATTIGSHSVMKSRTTREDGNINYRWCVNLEAKSFDITHRVSSSGSRATTTQDYATQIEEIIKTLKLTPAAS